MHEEAWEGVELLCILMVPVCAGNPYTLPTLMAFTGGHNITFGSDFPFAPSGSAAVTVNGLNDFLRADPMALWRIGRGTALNLVRKASSTAST